MSEKTKERILYVVGVIFITAVFISSCEKKEKLSQDEKHSIEKIGSGTR